MYDYNKEDAYLDMLLARELAEQDLQEEIDDLVFHEIEKLEAEGIELDEQDIADIERQVISDMRRARAEYLYECELERGGVYDETY